MVARNEAGAGKGWRMITKGHEETFLGALNKSVQFDKL